MADSVNLALPYLEAAQAQKHVTHNEALTLLDACVQLSVSARNIIQPPADPQQGERFIIDAAATGIFSGRVNQIAYWDKAGWWFLAPHVGWLAWVANESALFVFDESGWSAMETKLSHLQNLQRLGIGTTADAGNPFAAKLNAMLFAARTQSEGGNGDLRFTLNKQSPGSSVSQIYQTAGSARAETGLMGDDKFRIKVSDDGANWRVGLEIDPASGAVSFSGGAAGVPGLRFLEDEDTGLANVAADALSFVAGGVERARADGDGFFADAFAGNRYRLGIGALVSDASQTRVLSASDDGRIICFTSNSPVSVVAPAGLRVGFSCACIQCGAGVLTFSGGIGVSMGHVENAFRSGGRHASVSLLATASNAFVLAGALVS
jgi:hypothetical protein